MLRQLSREQSEAQQYRAHYESKELLSDIDLDELRRKQTAEITTIRQELDKLQARYHSLEKQQSRYSAEFKAARTDMEFSMRECEQREKKLKSGNKLMEEWRKRVDDLQSELEAAQRESKKQISKAHYLQTARDALQEQVEAFRRENKQLFSELDSLQVINYNSFFKNNYFDKSLLTN